jgi:hypothetical protein
MIERRTTVQAERAKKIRENLKKNFPNAKFSVTKRDGYSTIEVYILELDFNPFRNWGDGREWDYKKVGYSYLDWENLADIDLSKEGIEFAKSVMRVATEGRVVNSDSYHTRSNFDVELSYGDYNKPFKVVESTKKSSTKTSTSKVKKSIPETAEEMWTGIPDCGFEVFEEIRDGVRYMYFKPKQRLDYAKYKELAAELKKTFGIFYANAYSCFMSKGIEFKADDYSVLCAILSTVMTGEPFPTKKDDSLPATDKVIKEEGEKLPKSNPDSPDFNEYGLQEIKIEWHEGTGEFDNAMFSTWEQLQNAMLKMHSDFMEDNPAKNTYDKAKVEVTWNDGSFILDRIDVGYDEDGNFDPNKTFIGDYMRKTKQYAYTNKLKEDKDKYQWSDKAMPATDKVVEVKEGGKYSEMIGVVKGKLDTLYSVQRNSRDLKLDSGFRLKLASLNFVLDTLLAEQEYNPFSFTKRYFEVEEKVEEKANIDIVFTNDFREWFGDWTETQERISKREITAVEEDYGASGVSKVTLGEKPLMVYHGTSSEVEFSRFKFDKFPVMYFATNESYAKWFADLRGGAVFKCYLNIKELSDFTTFGLDDIYWSEIVAYAKGTHGVELPEFHPTILPEDRKKFWQFLRNDLPQLTLIDTYKKAGYNGFAHIENNPNDVREDGTENYTTAYTIFEANQVKSATVFSGANSYSPIMKMAKGGNIKKNN